MFDQIIGKKVLNDKLKHLKNSVFFKNLGYNKKNVFLQKNSKIKNKKLN